MTPLPFETISIRSRLECAGMPNAQAALLADILATRHNAIAGRCASKAGMMPASTAARLAITRLDGKIDVRDVHLDAPLAQLACSRLRRCLMTVQMANGVL